MKILEFENIKAVDAQIQSINTFKVEKVEMFQSVKLDEIVHYPAKFNQLLIKWLNDNQQTVIDAIKKQSGLEVELARIEAVNEAAQFLEIEQPTVEAAKMAADIQPMQDMTLSK